MFSQLFLWIYFVSKIQSLFTVFAVFSGVSFSIFLVATIATYFMKVDTYGCDLKEDESYLGSKKGLRISTLIFIPTLLLAVFTPIKKDVLIYAALKSVDNYNIENVDSNLEVDNILSIVDGTIERVENFLDEEE